MLQRVTGQHARHGNADLGEDVAGYQLVVAGQHLHRDAGFRHRPDRCAGAGFRWIQEDREASENQIGFVGDRGGLVAGIDQTAGDPQGAESLRAECVERGLERPTASPRRAAVPSRPRPGIGLDSRSRSSGAPLTISRRLASCSTRTETRRRSKSNGTSSIFRKPVMSNGWAARIACVERAFHPALELAVDIGIGKCVRTLGTMAVDRPHQLDRGFGQRAGLVGAQHVHGAQVVDRGQALHDHLALRHLHRRPGQRDRNDHRQQFRRQPDGERDGEHQRLQHRPSEDDVHDENEQHHQHGEPHDQHAEAANADGERGGRRLLGQAGREMAERRSVSGSTDQDGRGAADDRGAGENGVGGAGRVFRAGRGIADLLLGRIGLARQQRLVDVEIPAFEQPRVGGDKIAGDQFDNVAGDELLDRHRDARAVAPNGRLHGDRLAQRLDRVLRPHLLHEIKDDAEHDDAKDDDEACDVTGRGGHRARDQKDDDQRIAEAREELQPER